MRALLAPCYDGHLTKSGARPCPRFVAVYTMRPEHLAAFRKQAKSEQEVTDKVGLKT